MTTPHPEDGLRARLRALPSFGPDLPAFDPQAAPATPEELFLDWLEDAIAAGLALPHAATLSTADAAGRVHARTLLLKDVDAGAWCFATHRTSPKGRDLEENPHAALTFLWREHGRQVRLAGPVVALDPTAGARDFLARPEGSRAATLVGRQSEPLGSLAEYRTAFETALASVRADPGLVAASWAAYALSPTSVEFWAATPSSGQIRLRYAPGGAAPRVGGARWTKELLWP